MWISINMYKAKHTRFRNLIGNLDDIAHFCAATWKVGGRKIVKNKTINNCIFVFVQIKFG